MYNLIENLTDYVLQHNPYFNKGFANVTRDEEIGIVANWTEPVFPSQKHGDYFYIRYNGVVGLTNAPAAQMMEGQFGAQYNIPLMLVASVNNADSDVLFQNLLTTLSSYRPKGTQGVVYTSASQEMGEIVNAELAGLKPEDRRAALKRLPKYGTLVAIRFTLSMIITIQPLTCIQNPCEICS